jgi:hypothetical protein
MKLPWKFNDPEFLKKLLIKEYESIFLSKNPVSNNNLLNKKVPFMSEHEREMSENAIRNNKTKITLDSVNYYVNNLGARGEWGITNNSNAFTIAFFGCSFTFGVGIDEKDIFVNLVKDKLNISTDKELEIINLGYPGASIAKCSRLFKYITNVKKIDVAIFLFPTHLRDEFIYNNENGNSSYINLIPNAKPTIKNNTWELFYELMDDRNLMYRAIKDIDMIDNICELKKIKSFYSSWDYDTYLQINELISNKNKIMPVFRFLENENKNNLYARDGQHPGLESHSFFSNQIAEHLNNLYSESRKFI